MVNKAALIAVTTIGHVRCGRSLKSSALYLWAMPIPAYEPSEPVGRTIGPALPTVKSPSDAWF